MATAGVIGAVRRHSADGFVVRDLAKEVRQDRAIAFPTGRKLDRADIGCGGVHGKMDLVPFAPSLNTMLPGLPFSVAKELDTRAIHQQVQPSVGTAIREWSSPEQASPTPPNVAGPHHPDGLP